MHAVVLILAISASSICDGSPSDKELPEQAQILDPSAAGKALGLADVAALTQGAAADAVIIAKIRKSPTVFHLTGDQIIWLQQNGVHECVIKEMQATAAPPPAVGVGFVFHGH